MHTQADCLMMIRTGLNKKIYVATSADGASWDDERIAFCMGWQAPDTPQLVFDSAPSTPYMVRIGTNKHIYSGPNLDWDYSPLFDEWETPHTPALAVFKDRLYMVRTGTNRKIYVASSGDGTQWSWDHDALFDEWETPNQPHLTPVQAPAPLNRSQLDALIKKVAPDIVFDSKEQYFMASVDSFLQQATLYGKDGTRQKPARGHLPTTGKDDGRYWLEIDADARGGDLGKAVAYVQAKRTVYATDITFWLFSPFNGAGIVEIDQQRIDVQQAGFRFGEHTGDWEHVTIRINNFTGKAETAFLSEHGDGEWVRYDALEKNGHDRPLVYASLHGHANYSTTGDHRTQTFRIDIDDLLGFLEQLQIINHIGKEFLEDALKALGKSKHTTLFEFALRNETDHGSLFDCRNYHLVSAPFLSQDRPEEPRWLDYPYRWGPHIEFPQQYFVRFLRSVSHIDLPEPLMKYLAYHIDLILQKVPKEVLEENGPTGPQQKPSWTHFESR